MKINIIIENRTSDLWLMFFYSNCKNNVLLCIKQSTHSNINTRHFQIWDSNSFFHAFYLNKFFYDREKTKIHRRMDSKLKLVNISCWYWNQLTVLNIINNYSCNLNIKTPIKDHWCEFQWWFFSISRRTVYLA